MTVHPAAMVVAVLISAFAPPPLALAFLGRFSEAGVDGIPALVTVLVYVAYTVAVAYVVVGFALFVRRTVGGVVAPHYESLTYAERAREARLYPQLHTEPVMTGEAEPERVQPVGAGAAHEPPAPAPKPSGPAPKQAGPTRARENSGPAEDPRTALPTIEAVTPPTDGALGERAWARLILPGTVKEELRTIQHLLHDPSYLEREWGAEFGLKGLILAGPPGTGKTTIAKAIAASAGYRFFTVDPAQINSMWVGQSEKIIQELFRTARENAPAVVFLDEVDAIASARSGTSNDAGGAGRGRNAVLNQLLTEIDGFQTDSGGRVFTIAATNRADNLDAAFKSRLNYNLIIPLPEDDERRQLIELYFAGIIERGKLDVPVPELVARSAGMSGRDIRNIADAIPQIAFSAGQERATLEIVERAFQRVLRPDDARGTFR